MEQRSYEVIYLTGAPAAGKSTVLRALQRAVSPVVCFEYGARLLEYLRERGVEIRDQAELRARSAQVVMPEHIRAVDELLIEFVEANRQRAHVVIDTHAVTREEYGFRVTPYSLRDFSLLAPTQIWVLYVNPDIAVRRINEAPDGRRDVTPWEAGFHAGLQGSVAITYGMYIGAPVYFFDSSGGAERLAQELAARMIKSRPEARDD